MLIHADGQPSAGARQVLPDDATRVDHMANDKYLPIDQCQVGIKQQRRLHHPLRRNRTTAPISTKQTGKP
jgi:hypothetical protein